MFFGEITSFMTELNGEFWDHRVKSQGHWERKCRNRFSRISSWNVDRFTSN